MSVSAKSSQISRRGWLQSAAAIGTAALLPITARSNETPFIARPLGYVKLPDGRCLAYSEWGAGDAKHVVIHHHGIPSCRLDGESFIEALRCRPGVRLYVIDRPGIGCSSPYACKSFLNWPADLRCFVDALKIDRFAIMGASGGTPYALAAARAMPDRVTAVCIGCPMAPLEVVGRKTGSGAIGAQLATRHPLLSRIILGSFANAERRRPNRMPLLGRVASKPDHDLLLDPAERKYLSHIVDEAFRQGADQVVREAALLQTCWDNWLPEVRTHVRIIEGCEDKIAPPVMAKYLVSRLPSADLTLVPGEAHVSLGRHRAGDQLEMTLSPKPGVVTSARPASSIVSDR